MPRLNDSFTSESEKKKYLLCDGSTFSATEYPKLASLIGTTLPDLRGLFLQGASIENSNQFIPAGLPNITGQTFADNWANNSSSGAFYYVYTGHLNLKDHDKYNAGLLILDASRCSPVYGNSDTVQPPAWTVRYYIRAK